MENKDFDNLFKQDFDIAEPSIGHFDRFEKKLANQKTVYRPKKWKWLVMAASVALLFGLMFTQNNTKETLELADISPEMAETQDYFSTLIKTEIEKVAIQKTPNNQQLIDDTFSRLEELENQYNNLTLELTENDGDKRIIFAMISNFQQRVEILQNLSENLEEFKKFNTQKNETYS